MGESGLTGLLRESATERFQRENRVQGELMRKQQLIFDKLHATRLNQDAITDGILALLSLWAANSLLFRFPIRVILLIVPYPRLRRWLEQFSRAGVALTLLFTLRQEAIRMGIHNSIGSGMPYLRYIFATLRSGVARVPIVRRVLGNTLSRTSGEDEDGASASR